MVKTIRLLCNLFVTNFKSVTHPLGLSGLDLHAFLGL